MKLSDKQVQALVDWAYLEYDPDSNTGSGELFDAAFQVAKDVRDATEFFCVCGTIHNTQKCPNCSAPRVPPPSCNCHIPTGSVCDDHGCEKCRNAANSGP